MVLIMDPELYKAASEGQLRLIGNDITIDQLENQITPNGNTVLHVACQFGQLQFVRKIFAMYDDNNFGRLHNVLCCRNNKHETPLHLAAGNGYPRIVETIKTEMAKGNRITGILRDVNQDGNTPLHMAVRLSSNEEVIKLLILSDKTFKYPPNHAGETPLYIATEKADTRLLSFILENSASLDYSGPFGTTVVHAATSSTYHHGCLVKLLEHNNDLIFATNALGWTPLHYAVCKRKVDLVLYLLQVDNSVAYVAAENDKKQTAFHIASRKGYVDIMKVILEHCPYIWEMVDGNRKNVLHISADSAEEDSIKFILKQSWSKHLVNQKDDEGNTPIHLLHARRFSVLRLLPNMDFSWVDYDIVNNDNLCTRDVASRINVKQRPKHKTFPYMIGRNIIRDESEEMLIYGRKHLESETENFERKKNKLESVKQMANTHLIVAALIATVTFAAGFTLPGGYDADGARGIKGTAVLRRKATFKVFMVSNTIAMVSSVSAVFLYFTASLYTTRQDLFVRYKTAVYLVLIGLGAMVVAFMAGAHAVLENDVGIAIVGICCILFLLYILEFKSMGLLRHVRDIVDPRNYCSKTRNSSETRTRGSRFVFPFAAVTQYRERSGTPSWLQSLRVNKVSEGPGHPQAFAAATSSPGSSAPPSWTLGANAVSEGPGHSKKIRGPTQTAHSIAAETHSPGSSMPPSWLQTLGANAVSEGTSHPQYFGGPTQAAHGSPQAAQGPIQTGEEPENFRELCQIQ